MIRNTRVIYLNRAFDTIAKMPDKEYCKKYGITPTGLQHSKLHALRKIFDKYKAGSHNGLELYSIDLPNRILEDAQINNVSKLKADDFIGYESALKEYLNNEMGKEVGRKITTRPNPLHQGEGNPGAKLNRDKVLLIREMFYYGFTCSLISRVFKVSITTIHDIKKGKKWNHI